MQVYGRDNKIQKNDGGCVATIGFFDGVHRGHQFLLEQVISIAKEKNLSTAVITFPDSPSIVLNPENNLKLLTTPEEKVKQLHAFGIDYVGVLPFSLELSHLTARQFMTDVLAAQMNVRTLVMGYDHRFGVDGNVPLETYVNWGKEAGIRICQAESLFIGSQHVSSTAIRHALLNGRLQEANEYLGYDYELSGEVVEGYHLGTPMGYPTANIALSKRKLIPYHGVYAVEVQFADGQSATGMLNIGHRPTMDNGEDVSIEVHIFDFHQNIYKQQISVALKQFVRSERRFETVEELKRQLAADEQACRRLLGANT